MNTFLKYALLVAILLLSLGTQFIFTGAQYTDEQSYLTFRLIDITQDSFSFSYQDDLSFQGRELFLNPLLYKFLGIMQQDMPDPIFAYMYTAIMLLGAIVLVFLISDKLTKYSWHVIGATLLAAFLPITAINIFNTFTLIPLLLVAMLIGLYVYVQYLQKEKYAGYLYVTCIILSVIHPLMVLFVLGLLTYHGLATLEKKRTLLVEREVLLFTILFSFAVNYIIYFQAFKVHGSSLLWDIVSVRPFINFVEFVPLAPTMGFLVLAATIYIIYTSIAQQQPNFLLIVSSFTIVPGLLNIFGILSADTSMIFIGFFGSILCVAFFDIIRTILFETKAAKKRRGLLITIIILLAATQFLFFAYYGTISKSASQTTQVDDALDWIQTYTEPNAIIVTPIKFSQKTMYKTNRMTLADTQVLGLVDYKKRVSTIEKIYTSLFESQLLDLTTQAGLYSEQPGYIVVFANTQLWESNALKTTCMDEVYRQDSVAIYNVTCRVLEKST
ncbi:MAG: hypothetical protein ACI8Y7_000009 [Candidatus Woesearchaeota archaeon]|jgi:hypothetical protein